MLNFVLTYFFGYLMGMFITRHVFLKIIKQVYVYGHARGFDVGINILRLNSHDEAANLLETKRKEAEEK